GERLRVLDLEAALDRAHREHVERVVAVVRELLQPVRELARLAPVPGPPDAADVDRAVGADARAAHAGLEALRHAEHGALLLARDLLEVRALEAAVRDVAD